MSSTFLRVLLGVLAYPIASYWLVALHVHWRGLGDPKFSTEDYIGLSWSFGLVIFAPAALCGIVATEIAHVGRSARWGLALANLIVFVVAMQIPFLMEPPLPWAIAIVVGSCAWFLLLARITRRGNVKLGSGPWTSPPPPASSARRSRSVPRSWPRPRSG